MDRGGRRGEPLRGLIEPDGRGNVMVRSNQDVELSECGPDESGREIFPSQCVDCELFLSGRNQARLTVADRHYSGRPSLDTGLEDRLFEGAALEPIRYGT